MNGSHTYVCVAVGTPKFYPKQWSNDIAQEKFKMHANEVGMKLINRLKLTDTELNVTVLYIVDALFIFVCTQQWT